MSRPKGPKGIKQLYGEEIKTITAQRVPALRTVQDWYAKGTKYAAIASGGQQLKMSVTVNAFIFHFSGSMYSLILVAGMGLRVPLGDMPGDITPYGNAFRCPDPGAFYLL